MLEACLGEIWLEVQKKLSTCLSSMSFELLKFDEFIEIITMSNKLVKKHAEKRFCPNIEHILLAYV